MSKRSKISATWQPRLRAERRAGQLLIRMAATGERDAGKGGDYTSVMRQTRRTLKDLKVLPGQSKRWQQLAKLDGEDFEAFVRSTKRTTIDSIRRSQKNWAKRDQREARPAASEAKRREPQRIGEPAKGLRHQ